MISSLRPVRYVFLILFTQGFFASLPGIGFQWMKPGVVGLGLGVFVVLCVAGLRPDLRLPLFRMRSDELVELLFDLLRNSVSSIPEPFNLDPLGLAKGREFANLWFVLSFLFILLARICCSLRFGLRMRSGVNNAGVTMPLRWSSIVLLGGLIDSSSEIPE